MKVSVIIVNYNGKEFLHNCLQACLKSDYSPYEVIVVDNASTDGSVSYVRERLKDAHVPIKIIANEKNVGPSMARNQATQLATGELLAFLDNDCAPEKSWMKAGVAHFSEEDIGALQCKLLLDSDYVSIDSVGYYMSRFGFLVQRAPLGKFKDHGQFNLPTEIFGAKSAAMFVRRKSFDAVGGFDPDFFIYLEETDLCWRIWLSGYRILYAPRSVVYHVSGTTRKISPKVAEHLLYFHGTKNYITMLLKNLSISDMAFTLPVHLILWFLILAFMFLKGRKTAGLLIIQGMTWNLRKASQTLRKRNGRARPLRVLDRGIVRGATLSYYVETLRRF